MWTELRQVMKKHVFSKFSVQLVVSFFGICIIIIAVAFVVLYFGIEKILIDSNKRHSIQQFSQCEYNIDSFCDDVDLISRQLISRSELQDLADYSSVSEDEQIYAINHAFQQFSNVFQDCKYIDSISYFGADDLILHGLPNGNYIKQRKTSAENWFYNTEPYQNAKNSGQKLVWFGGYSDRNFTEPSDKPAESSVPDKPVFYISAARTTMAGNRSGVLVLNIDMHYFTSIFNHSQNNGLDKVYMIDEKGKIISSLDDSLVGKTSSIYREISGNQDNQTVILMDGGEKQQVIYYRLSNLGSTLVSEIPFSVISGDVTMLRYILLALFLFSMVAALLISRYWVSKLLNPLNQMMDVINKTGQGTLGLTMHAAPDNEFGILMRQFNKMSTRIRDLFERNKLIEEEKRNIEIDALRWQINPHFIYNTLNTIKWMAMISGENNITDCVATLSDFLEPIFRSKDILCTINDEVSHTRDYIKIMNYRFAGKFQYHIDIPEEYKQFRVMRFILQPVVENSLMHGLVDQPSGEVSISAWLGGGKLWIQVKDNGKGISETELEKIWRELNEDSDSAQIENGKIGLTNVNRRLKLHFGKEYGLEVESSTETGTKVRLKMPIVR